VTPVYAIRPALSVVAYKDSAAESMSDTETVVFAILVFILFL
jgi:hypothetical protein